MTDAEAVGRRMLEALIAQATAIDFLMRRLHHADPSFNPAKSPIVPLMEQAAAAILAAEEFLLDREARS